MGGYYQRTGEEMHTEVRGIISWYCDQCDHFTELPNLAEFPCCAKCGRTFPSNYKLKEKQDTNSALAQFDTAIGKVTQERGQTYGHPTVDFARAASLKAIVALCPDPLVRHALEMICVKMARLIQSPDHTDSWIDIAGYARCAVMLYSGEEKK